MVISPETNFQGQRNYKLLVYPGLSLPFYPECLISLPNFSKTYLELNKFKPDLIHVATEFSLGLCGLKYATSTGLPIVSSYHTNFPQYLSYYKLGFFTNWAWKYLRWFHNHCLMNFCPSNSTLKQLRQKGIKNLDIWGRGIDTDFYNPAKFSLSFRERFGKEKKLLLYVGRLAPEKDLDILLESFKIVNQKIHHTHLVIVGDGPLRQSLQRSAPPNVTFTGYLQSEELSVAYASSDIFVFPSTTETFGNVVLESMSSGLPVVAAYSGGVKENVINRQNGLACDPRSVVDMVAAMEQLILNEPLRKELSLKARDYAKTKSWDAIFNKLIYSYEGIIRLHNKPA